MPLPAAVLQFLTGRAESCRAAPLRDEDDLFTTGTLDSFALVELVQLLEDACGVRVPDRDVDPRNFQSVVAIARYVDERQG